MEVSSFFKDCYDRRVRSFKDHFRQAAEFPDTDSIHEMRVDLKRLRTFFGLIETVEPRYRAEEAFTPARKLFRAAGKLRNLHVLEAEAREAAKAGSLELSEYYNWLKDGERREVKKFGRACRRFDRGFFDSAWVSIASCLAGPGARRARTGAEARLLELIGEIREDKTRWNDVRRLHFLRTRTKEARYTLEIIEEGGFAGDDGTLLNDRLRGVHQPLGRWHDKEIVLDSLREFRKRREPGPLWSFKSYLEFSRLTKARKSEDLAGFEAALAALSEFLGGVEKRIFTTRPVRRKPAAEARTAREPPRNGGASVGGSVAAKTPLPD
ncbi:MAG TPA: CHAD domain-containing protein [Terriglobales bacterium]|nr:CHAD domain-containing protein [Terriglobales bacterium]